MISESTHRTSSLGDLAEVLRLEDPVVYVADQYRQLIAKSEGECLTAVRAMVAVEYELSDADLKAFTLIRLKAWLELEPADAKVIAQAYNQVMAEMPADAAMRRVVMVQTLLASLQPPDVERLREIIPASIAGPKLGRSNLATADRQQPPRRRWLFFGKRTDGP